MSVKSGKILAQPFHTKYALQRNDLCPETRIKHENAHFKLDLTCTINIKTAMLVKKRNIACSRIEPMGTSGALRGH